MSGLPLVQTGWAALTTRLIGHAWIRASKDAWESRPRGVGKGSEYHIASLPAETRSYLAKQAVASVAEQVSSHAAAGCAVANLLDTSETAIHDKLESGRRLLNLAPKQRKRVDARLLILQVADVFLAAYRSCGQGEVGGLYSLRPIGISH